MCYISPFLEGVPGHRAKTMPNKVIHRLQYPRKENLGLMRSPIQGLVLTHAVLQKLRRKCQVLDPCISTWRGLAEQSGLGIDSLFPSMLTSSVFFLCVTISDALM